MQGLPRGQGDLSADSLMRIASIIGLVTGLASLIGLIAWQGVADIADVMFRSDWRMLLVPLVWLPTLFMNARCWQLLFHPDRTPRFWPISMPNGWAARSIPCCRSPRSAARS